VSILLCFSSEYLVILKVYTLWRNECYT
jgi:hypothetical protein